MLGNHQDLHNRLLIEMLQEIQVKFTLIHAELAAV